MATSDTKTRDVASVRADDIMTEVDSNDVALVDFYRERSHAIQWPKPRLDTIAVDADTTTPTVDNESHLETHLETLSR